MVGVMEDLLRKLHVYEPLKNFKHALKSVGPRAKKEEAVLSSLFAMFVAPGDLVIDVGANVGERTRLFGSLGARVVAVEPQPSCVKVLRRRFRDSSSVQIVEMAVGAEKGSADMYVSTARPLSSLSAEWVAAVARSGRFRGQQWPTTIRVEVSTLDSLIEEYGAPGFIKIDVEGYEYKVLQGLHTSVPACSLEYTPERAIVALDCIEYLSELGMVWFNCNTSDDPRLQAEWMRAFEMKESLARLGDRDESGDIFAARVRPS